MWECTPWDSIKAGLPFWKEASKQSRGLFKIPTGQLLARASSVHRGPARVLHVSKDRPEQNHGSWIGWPVAQCTYTIMNQKDEWLITVKWRLETFMMKDQNENLHSTNRTQRQIISRLKGHLWHRVTTPERKPWPHNRHRGVHCWILLLALQGKQYTAELKAWPCSRSICHVFPQVNAFSDQHSTWSNVKSNFVGFRYNTHALLLQIQCRQRNKNAPML